MAEGCCVTQLIDANGEFNAAGLQKFVNTVKLHQCGLFYAVVAVMGPQSSGKSTLLNHLFGTNFREMNALQGRSQTTKGVWIAKAVGIEPLTIVMDLEGTDSRERGEDDATFEKQSALFALAVADIVLINIWCHDIGREHASNKPLLKTVFQVMLRLFSHRKTTLLFVIRDKTKTPFKILEDMLKEDIQKIWDTLPKPQAYEYSPLREFFNVEFVALSSYETREKQFKEEVSKLRQKFFNSVSPGGLAGDRRDVVPASGFSFSTEQIWKVIKENKDLDLPSHKVMVATVRCEEIANEKFSHLASDQEWMALEQAVKSGAVPFFGKRISSILEKYLSEYDMESVYFEEGVRNAKRIYLESKVLQLVYPVYISMLGHLRSRAFESFKTHLEQSLAGGEEFAASVRNCSQHTILEFDQGCLDAAIQQASWDTSKVREKLCRDIEAHVSIVRSEKLSELIAKYKAQISAALTEPLESLFESGGKNTWASIRRLLKRESDLAISAFSSAVAGFELDQEIFENMIQSLNKYSRSVVEMKAREEAGKVLVHMKDRFVTIFNHDKDSLPRVWTGKEDITEITKEARSEALKLLSTMAAIRLDEKADNIENILFSTLMDSGVAKPSQNKGIGTAGDPLASSMWDEVPPEKMLITPKQCKSIWRQFVFETEYAVTQAIAAQEAHKQQNSWLPPPWTIMAMFILGLNEIMFLLRNPLYLLVLFITYLLGKAIWIQMDIPADLHNGTLSTVISLSRRFVPTVINLVRRLASGNYASLSPQRRSSQSFRNEMQKSDSVSSSIPDSSVSTETSVEYISPQLKHKIETNPGQEETSLFQTNDQ